MNYAQNDKTKEIIEIAKDLPRQAKYALLNTAKRLNAERKETQKSIRVNNNEMLIKEYKGNRVITFRDIDTVHQRPEGTARRNFNTNKAHLIPNVDYFVRNSYEAKHEFEITAPNGLILLTESGYLMLVKSFTDDLAWDVQRTLVNCYFRTVKNQPAIEQPYEFVMKYYCGEPVVTLKDIEFKTGISTYTLKWHVEKLKLGKDYFILTGQDLLAFKAENPKVNTKFISNLIILNETGFIKLAKLIKQSKNCIEFIPLPKPQSPVPTVLRVDIPQNPAIQAKMRDVADIITTLKTTLAFYNRYFTPEDKDHFSRVLRSIGFELYNEVTDLAKMPANLISR